jgi:hypothetical protein
VASALGILAFTFMCFAGYTLALERLFHRLLKDSSSKDDLATQQRHRQAAVLLRVYIGKLNLAFLLGMTVYVVARRATDWRYGLLLILLCGVGGILLATTWLPPNRMVEVLITELERRRDPYRNGDDPLQLQAVESLLTRLRLMKQKSE